MHDNNSRIDDFGNQLISPTQIISPGKLFEEEIIQIYTV